MKQKQRRVQFLLLLLFLILTFIVLSGLRLYSRMVKLGLGQLTVLNKDSSLALRFVLLHLKFYLGGTERIRPVLSIPKIFEKKFLYRPYVQFLVNSVIFLLLYQQSKMTEIPGGRTQTYFIAQLYFVFKRNKHTWKGGTSAKRFVGRGHGGSGYGF